MSDNGKKLLQKAGPGGYDIYVETDALRDAAKQLRAIIDGFHGRVGGFPSATHLPRRVKKGSSGAGVVSYASVGGRASCG